MLVWLLIGCFFMLMLVRIGLPFGIKSEGSVVATVTLTYREKLLLHRTNLYTLGALLVLSAIGKWFPTTVELVIILAALALVNLPVRYQFTTLGIACNNVLFRKWKEFEYVRYRGAKLTLMPRKGFSALPLTVLASRHDEVLPYFQRFLQVSNEAPPKFLERPIMLWLRRRLSPLP
jgi:ammonium transporter, Amt family